MSGADFGNFAQIGSLILSVVVWIHTIVVSRSKASDNRVKNAEDNIGNVDKRVGIIEARLVSVPQTTDVHEMDLRNVLSPYPPRWSACRNIWPRTPPKISRTRVDRGPTHEF